MILCSFKAIVTFFESLVLRKNYVFTKHQVTGLLHKYAKHSARVLNVYLLATTTTIENLLHIIQDLHFYKKTINLNNVKVFMILVSSNGLLITRTPEIELKYHKSLFVDHKMNIAMRYNCCIT